MVLLPLIKIFPGIFLTISQTMSSSQYCIYFHYGRLLIPKGMVNSVIILAFITAALDMMNNALVSPILPYLVKEMGSSTMQEGFFFSSYSIMQLISLLIMGPMSDVYGRKPFLLLSLFGSCFGCVFQGLSKNMTSLIIWRAFTGLFAGSRNLVQSVIADLIPAESRSIYLTRLNACCTVAYIIGPVFGGLLGLINNQVPLLAAGAASGVAMLVALFLLKESNPRIVDENGNRRLKITKPTEPILKPKRVRPKLTSLMMMCFLSEFCTQWYCSSYAARYGIYLTDKFNVPSLTFGTATTLQSLVLAVFQTYGFSYFSTTLNIPMPFIAIGGYFIMLIGYYFIVLSRTSWGSLVAVLIGLLGFSTVAPISPSIISTSNPQEVQGEVLSWNSFFYQGSLVISPLVLSAIYMWNKDMTFYLSSITAIIGIILMICMSCRSDMKLLGKKETFKVKEEVKEEETANMGEDKIEASINIEEVKPIEVVPVVVSLYI